MLKWKIKCSKFDGLCRLTIITNVTQTCHYFLFPVEIRFADWTFSQTSAYVHSMWSYVHWIIYRFPEQILNWWTHSIQFRNRTICSKIDCEAATIRLIMLLYIEIHMFMKCRICTQTSKHLSFSLMRITRAWQNVHRCYPSPSTVIPIYLLFFNFIFV